MKVVSSDTVIDTVIDRQIRAILVPRRYPSSPVLRRHQHYLIT